MPACVQWGRRYALHVCIGLGSAPSPPPKSRNPVKAITVECSERRAGGSTPSLKCPFLQRFSSGRSCEDNKRRKTETFSASALAVGMPKACYPSSTQPGPEGVPSQIRAVDRPDSWSLGRLHPPLDAVARHNTFVCLFGFLLRLGKGFARNLLTTANTVLLVGAVRPLSEQTRARSPR